MSELLSINDFCKQAKICKATFYALKKQGKAPLSIKIGKRTLISRAAFEAWIEELEAAGANNNRSAAVKTAKQKGAC